MNLYFLVSINIDGSVTLNTEEQYLPQSFLNVSGFNNLEFNNPEFLPNLNWLNRPDLGFWLANVGYKPVVNFYEKLIKTNIINNEQKTVSVSYSVASLTQEEINVKKNNVKTSYIPIRDSYLKLTDFTQLMDAPISDQAKSDFLNFRKQLRIMFDIDDYTQLVWPLIPTSAPNVYIPPFPEINLN